VKPWVKRKNGTSPGGAAENLAENLRSISFAPPGLDFILERKPAAQAVGYYLVLLRSLKILVTP
jgi:hypothetical protein